MGFLNVFIYLDGSLRRAQKWLLFVEIMMGWWMTCWRGSVWWWNGELASRWSCQCHGISWWQTFFRKRTRICRMLCMTAFTSSVVQFTLSYLAIKNEIDNLISTNSLGDDLNYAYNFEFIHLWLGSHFPKVSHWWAGSVSTASKSRKTHCDCTSDWHGAPSATTD